MGDTHSPLHYPVLGLKVIGIYSSTNSKRVAISSLFYITVLLFSICMVSIQFPNMDGEVLAIVSNLEAFFAYSQHLGKLTVIFKKQKEFTKLLQKIKQFWKTGVCPDHVKIKLDYISTASNKVVKVFICCILTATIGMIIYSAVERKLPLAVWNLKGYEVLYNWTLVLQTIGILIAGSVVSLFDCIFFLICIQTIIQFKILCYCLTDLRLSNVISEDDQKQYSDKLKFYIQHHNFLLGFLRDLQTFYSPAFTIQIITTAPICCAELYAVLDTDRVDPVMMRHLLQCTSIIFQLSFYGIVADYVSLEALTVGDAIYASEWYSNDFTTLGKPIALLIQKSQQPIIFTAGGLFEIKATTVLTVMRVSWSACTVMRGLQKKK